MTFKPGVTQQYLPILTFIVSLFLSACALQQPPTGGKKDIIPPKLISSIPPNGSLNYIGKNIILTFDEYIDIDPLIKQQLIITPNFEEYTYKPIKRGIFLTIEKPLEPNTTYTLNFRKAIRDLNEKNPAQNLKLVFSTGSLIDSLKINGLVKDAETNKPIFDGLVSLYKAGDTLDVLKHKPFYFTRTDSSGRYLFENLQADTYKIYAYTDGNNNLTYQEKSEKIGFLENNILLKGSSLTGINFFINRSDQTPPKISGRGSEEKYATLEFSEGLKKVKIDFQDPAQTIPYNPSDEKTVLFYNTRQQFDSIPLRVIAEDSSGNVLEKEVKIKFTPPKKEKKEKDKIDKIKFETKITPENGRKITRDFEAIISFNKPIKTFNPLTLSLLADTVKKIELTEKDTSWNEFRTVFTLKKQVKVKEKLRLSIDKGSFMSIENDSSAKVKNDYSLKIEEEYGTIAGTINLKTPENFIVQLLTTDYKIVAEQANVKDYKFDFVEPGQYQLRVIIDKNKNGRWDGGDFKRKTLPEKMYYLGPIPMKQNFEMTENNFNLP